MRRCSCLIYSLMYLIWNSWTSILRYQIRRDMASSKNHEEYFNMNTWFLRPFIIKLSLSLEEGKFFNCHFLFWAIFKIRYTNTPLKTHSATTWTKFYPILTPSSSPLGWTIVDILHDASCHMTKRGISTDPLSPLLVHVVIEWPLHIQRSHYLMTK